MTATDRPDDRADEQIETPAKPCPFCQIAQGEGDVELFADTGSVLIFEPLNPVTPGHLLVVSTRHVEDFTESPATTALVMDEAARFARSHRQYDQANVITSRGSAATQTVKHLHVHLVPRREGDGLPLPWTNQSSRAGLLAAPADQDNAAEPWANAFRYWRQRALDAEAEVERVKTGSASRVEDDLRARWRLAQDQVKTYMAEADKADRRAEKAEARFTEVEKALDFHTTCLSCAGHLDLAYQAEERAKRAEDERDRALRVIESQTTALLDVGPELRRLRAQVAAVLGLADEWQRELDSGAIRDEKARYCWGIAVREVRAALDTAGGGDDGE